MLSVPQPNRRPSSTILRLPRTLLPALAGVLLCAQPARSQNARVQGPRVQGPQIALPADIPVPPETSAGYPVTGRVVCADTQRAARFANVVLVPAAPEGEGGGRGGRASARTDLDGNFLIPNVPPGEYYVTAALSGYINEAPILQAALANASPSANSIPAGVPKIRVSAGGSSAQLSLERGGVLAGTVQWDDGSPAAGVGIGTVPVPAAAGAGTAAAGSAFGSGAGFGGGFGNGFSGSQTDDRGHFRLSGIAPGTYWLRASVQAPAPAVTAERRTFPHNLNLAVYAPDRFRRTEAAAVTVAAGEERNDLSITMHLAALHSVSGTVSSAGGPVRSGTVTLTDSTDGALNRTGNVNADGTFLVPYLPPGNYNLRAAVSSGPLILARGQLPGTGSATVRFDPLEESLTVADSDITGLSLNVAVAAATGTAP